VKNDNLPAIEHVRSTQNEWMTTVEAAAYLRTKPRTLLKWVRAGSIKAWPLHGAKRRTWRFRKEDLDAALGFAQTGNSDSVLFSKTSSVALQ
jgi:excisionase family DNA binding protein